MPPDWKIIPPAAAVTFDPTRRGSLLAEASQARLGELARSLESAGILIDRMSCPALVAQLKAAGEVPVDTVVCGALDADEALPINRVIANSAPDPVQFAIQWLARACGAGRSMIVADRSFPPAPRDSAGVVEQKFIAHAYPQLHPSLLLKLLLNRPLSPAKLPVERGVLVIDAAAAWTIAQLLCAPERPMVPLAVCDERNPLRRRTHYAMAAPTARIGEVLTELAGAIDEDTIVRLGARQRDQHADLSAVVGTKECTVLISRRIAPRVAEPCTRCGWCADVCPAGVRPALALESVHTRRRELAQAASVSACIDCGLCQYVCPSHLPLLDAVRWTAEELGTGS